MSWYAFLVIDKGRDGYTGAFTTHTGIQPQPRGMMGARVFLLHSGISFYVARLSVAGPISGIRRTERWCIWSRYKIVCRIASRSPVWGTVDIR